MSKDKTLWTNGEAKWKPRNKQAALICIKAKDIHLPPPEPPINVLEQRALEARQIQERAAQAAISLAEMEAAHRQKQREDAIAAREKRKEHMRGIKPENFRNLWMAKWLKRQARAAGKPKPTPQEIRPVRRNLYAMSSPS